MSDTDSMDLLCIKYDGWEPRIRAGNRKRAWMDSTNERYAYRCLPLSIANSHGWELLSPVAFEAKWDGGDSMESVEVRLDPGYPEHKKPVTLFGYGTLTWHVEAIFRTPPGWNLHVSGPFNRQKDAIQALSAVIETDWSPYTFTMNWRFTRADQWIRFEENEPIAHFFPVERGRVERFRPRIERLEDHPDLRAAFEKWSASRNAFQRWIAEAPPETPGEKWQKLYFRGLDADGAPGAPDHQSKLRVPSFVMPDGSLMEPPEPTGCPIRSQPPALRPLALEQAPTLSASGTMTGNVLLNYAGGKGPGANPALALALGRIGFGETATVTRSEPAASVAPKPTDTAGHHEWLAEAQARQAALAASDGIARVGPLSREAFLRDHYSASRPVIITGALADWPALSRWTPDDLAARIGAAAIDYGEGDGSFGTMPFDALVTLLASSAPGDDRQITAANEAANRAALAPLAADLGQLEAYLASPRFAPEVAGAGSFAPLAMAPQNHLIAQICGSRAFIIAAPAETRRLQLQPDGRSAVRDLTDEGQLRLFPEARAVQAIEFELEPGELLYLPLGWWRQATALDFTLSVVMSDFLWPNDTAPFAKG